MKLLFVIVLILFASVALTLTAMDNPGYVLIAREPWSVELSLAVFVALLTVGLLLLGLLWNGLVKLWNTPRDVANWRRARRSQRARESLTQGLIHLTERQWELAEKEALAHVHNTPTPLLNYLIAAFAAQGMGHYEKRDEYLALAHQASPDQAITTGMAQAQLQLFSRQLERALATLTQLRTLHPKNAPILELLARCFRELHDWDNLASIIPELRKYKALSNEQIDAVELEAHRELLTLSLPSGSANVLHQAWNAVPAHLRRHPDLLALYAQHLMAQNEVDECEQLLVSAIEQNWSDRLIRLYGLLQTSHPATQLETAESWLATQNDRPILLLTLGRLAARNRQFGKAREYLEKAILLRGPAECHRELGALFEQLGERDKAMEQYRRALDLYSRDPSGGAPRLLSPGFPERRGAGAAHYGY